MLSILNRYILRSLVVNYAIALAVMISLYIVLDLFFNMDEFTEKGDPTSAVVKNIISYYWPNVFLYFAQLSAVITVFACMATIARLRRLNELTAMLASGVSMYRIAVPVLGFGVATAALLVIDTEWIIPTIAHRLARDHDDVDGSRAYGVIFLNDREGSLLSAGRFDPATFDLQRMLVLTRDQSGAIVSILDADRATWEPPTALTPQGRWRLERSIKRTPGRAASSPLAPQSGVVESSPQFYESDLGPEAIQLRQVEGWLRYLSLKQLNELAEKGAPNQAAITRTRHARRVAPLMSIVLLLLGLPFFLDRSPTSVLSDAGKCMITCGLCYVAMFVAQNVQAGTDSALPFWIPIFVFAPIAIVLIDRIRT